jgi:hypothetical protein
MGLRRLVCFSLLTLAQRIDTMDAKLLTELNREAMRLASLEPSQTNGKYVVRRLRKPKWDESEFLIIDNDPDKPQIRNYDVLVYATPDKCIGIGRWRNYVSEDGTVDFG